MTLEERSSRTTQRAWHNGEEYNRSGRAARLFLLLISSMIAIGGRSPTPASGQEQPERPAAEAKRPPRDGRSTREFLGLGAPPDEAAAKLGDPLYKQNCATCHGENGRGAQGPNLLRSTLVLHDEKGQDISQIILNGRPQSGMPAFPKLKPDERHQIAEYIRLQVEMAANRGLYGAVYAGQRSKTSGDPTKGGEFFAVNCSGCHSATGDLAGIGRKFPEAATLQARFIWPRSKAPFHATVKTASGESINGLLMKIDDFDVVLRDAAGETHHWSREQVQVQWEDPLAGHRALLPKYSDADLHNLTAYLMGLK